MQCIESTSLSVLWNGGATQTFKPGRGIRQGDPLSPYIFVMCLERLSQIINRRVEENSWKPFSVRRNGLKISHLCFADDMLLFTEASLEQLEIVSQCMDMFCSTSGQKVSATKTRIFFFKNVSTSLTNAINRRTKF